MTPDSAGIFDVSGRYLAPASVELPVRPMGPWDQNHDVEPTAVFAHHQPSFDDGPGFPMYHVIGGPSHKSTVSAMTLEQLGIAVPPVVEVTIVRQPAAPAGLVEDVQLAPVPPTADEDAK